MLQHLIPALAPKQVSFEDKRQPAHFLAPPPLVHVHSMDQISQNEKRNVNSALAMNIPKLKSSPSMLKRGTIVVQNPNCPTKFLYELKGFKKFGSQTTFKELQQVLKENNLDGKSKKPQDCFVHPQSLPAKESPVRDGNYLIRMFDGYFNETLKEYERKRFKRELLSSKSRIVENKAEPELPELTFQDVSRKKEIVIPIEQQHKPEKKQSEKILERKAKVQSFRSQRTYSKTEIKEQGVQKFIQQLISKRKDKLKETVTRQIKLKEKIQISMLKLKKFQCQAIHKQDYLSADYMISSHSTQPRAYSTHNLTQDYSPHSAIKLPQTKMSEIVLPTYYSRSRQDLHTMKRATFSNPELKGLPTRIEEKRAYNFSQSKIPRRSMIEPLLGLFKLTQSKNEIFLTRKSSNRQILPALSPSNKQLQVYNRSRSKESPGAEQKKKKVQRNKSPYITQKRTVKPFCKKNANYQERFLQRIRNKQI